MAEKTQNNSAGLVMRWPEVEQQHRQQRAQELLREYDARRLREYNGVQEYLDVQRLLDERKKATEHAG